MSIRHLMWSACCAALLVGAPASAHAASPAATFDGADADRTRIAVRLTLVAEGLRQPTDIQRVPGQPGVVIVLEKAGTARRVDTATGRHTVWFDMPVPTRSEQGLLGLAFHPDFATNGRFYVNSSARDGRRRSTRITAWVSQRGASPARSAPRQTGLVLEVDQPWINHNAGQLAFGPDGMLYVGFGDGGAADDPKGHGQDRSTLLGAMLRLDVSAGGAGYAVPPDNPFVKTPGVRPEIWAWGLRNPWRYAFAPDGRLVVADVGQNRLEEVAIVGRGENHGWNAREGAACFPHDRPCRPGDFVPPVWQYPRSEGTSITGGYVYRGRAIPALRGRYVFGDFASGRLWALTLPPRGAMKGLAAADAIAALGRWPVAPSSFGVTADGEMLLADFAGGRIYRLEADR